MGAKGLSIRTGIPGLTFRRSWGKGGDGAIIGLLVMSVIGAINLSVFLISLSCALLVISLQVLWVLIAVGFNLVMWLTLTAGDYVTYLKSKKAAGSRPSTEAD